MRHSKQRCAISVQNCALWNMGQVHYGICENKDHQQCLLYLVVKLGTVNLLPGKGTNPSFKNGILRKITTGPETI